MLEHKLEEEDLQKINEQPQKRGRGRPKGAKNKHPRQTHKKEVKEVVVKPEPIIVEEKPKKVYRNAGRKKGSLNKSTIEKIMNKEILDPRIYPKTHYDHPGRPKETRKYKREKAFRESLLKPKVKVVKHNKLTEQERLEKCRSYAVDWCYKHNAELYKYSEQFFVFRYKNDPVRRRYQIGYEYGDYPAVWLPFTASDQSRIEM